MRAKKVLYKGEEMGYPRGKYFGWPEFQGVSLNLLFVPRAEQAQQVAQVTYGNSVVPVWLDPLRR